TLFHDSLTFRWEYWRGASGVVAERPVVGVGLENFGTHYRRARLPEAPEEVADPHNLLVKLAAELGVIGLLLGLAWLGRLAWEVTRPVVPLAPAEASMAARWESRAEAGASAVRVTSVVAITAM